LGAEDSRTRLLLHHLKQVQGRHDEQSSPSDSDSEAASTLEGSEEENADILAELQQEISRLDPEGPQETELHAAPWNDWDVDVCDTACHPAASGDGRVNGSNTTAFELSPKRNHKGLSETEIVGSIYTAQADMRPLWM